MAIDLEVLRKIGEYGHAKFVGFYTDSSIELVPIEDVSDKPDIVFIGIRADILHQDDDTYYFANGKQTKKLPQVHILPRDSRLTATVRHNQDFFSTEEYMQKTIISSVLLDYIQAPPIIKQEIPIIVEKRIGTILRTAPKNNPKYDPKLESLVTLTCTEKRPGNIFIQQINAREPLNLPGYIALIESIYNLNAYSNRVKRVL